MISACMTVSVRELRTAVREWACCQAVICEQKTGRHQTCDNCLSNGPLACSRLKIVSMNRKYHNHKLQTNPCEEESHNNHETLGRQTKQRKPALNTASCDEKHSTTAYRGIIMFHNIKKVNLLYP